MGAHKINLHNLLQNTPLNCIQNVYWIIAPNIIEIQSRNLNFNAVFNDLNYHRHLRAHLIGKPNSSHWEGSKTQRWATIVTSKINTKCQTSWLKCLGAEQFVLCFTLNKQIWFVGEKQPIPYKGLKCAPSLHHGNGKKYADFHIGTINEPTALQSLISDLTLFQRVW